MSDTTLTITMPLPFPLLTINFRSGKRWQIVSLHTREQRRSAYYVAREAFGASEWPVEYDGPVRLDVEIRPRKNQKRLDPSAVFEALKATVDGIEDAEIVRDDKQISPGTITWSKQRTGELILTLTREGKS